MRKKKSYFLIIGTTLLLFPGLLFCQPGETLEKKGEEAFAEKEFNKSYQYFGSALTKAEENPSLWFKYAEAAMQVNDHPTAEKYFTKVLQDNENFLFPLTSFRLAQVKKSLGKYEDAIELFQAFSMMEIDQHFTNWASNEIQVCEWAMKQPATNISIKIDLLDENINTPYSEMAPLEMGNHLYYSSRRSVLNQDKETPKRRQTRMMFSKNLERGRPVINEFTNEGKHFGNTAFSHDWQRMYFTVCEYLNSEDIRCEIYFRDQDKNGKWKRKSQRLPGHINVKGSTTTHPCIGYDSFAQKEILFFASDRSGGVGKMDLWYCEVDDYSFSEVRNLWQINTPEDEMTPSYHQATQTLTFSSNGYRGFGGMDILYCEKFGVDQWEMVQNMGRPINSGYDDLYFSKNTNGNRAHFSSNRPGSGYPRSRNEGCCLDIYRVYYNALTEKTNDQ